MADRNLVLQLLITAKDQASTALDRLRDGLGGVRQGVAAALEPLRSFGALLTAAVGVGGGKELIDRADAYTRLTNQLRVATTSEEGYRAALDAVTAIAQRSNADLASTASLYGKVAQTAEALGLQQQQVAEVTELVAKAMQLSGADTNTAAGAIQQLGQALASGTLRGDEFNSIMEASPKLMEALAAGLGIAVGELRSLAEAGQLTADRVVNALLTQKAAIDEVYGKLPQTVGQAMTGLANAGTLFVGQLNEQTGATRSLTDGLAFLARNLDAVAALIGAGFAAAVARGAAAMAQYAQAALVARAAAQDQVLASAAQQQAALASAQAQVAAAQATYNRALAEQRSALALQVAIEQTFGLVAGEEALTAARAQASAAAAAASAATTRYAEAQAALNALQAQSAAATGLFSRALGFLTGPGGLILLAVAAFAGLYAAFSRQKPATDALALSTDQYADAVQKATVAQLAMTKVELERTISAQNKAVEETAKKVERAAWWYEQVVKAQGKTESAMESLTAAQAALDTETQKLNELNQRRNVLLREQETRQQALNSADANAVAGYSQQAGAMDRLTTAIQDRAKHLKTVSDAQIAETEALLAKVEAEGKSNEIERVTIQLAQQRAGAAKVAAELMKGEANAASIKVAALEAIERTQGSLTAQQQIALRVAREDVVAKTAEAVAAEALAGKLDAQAQSTATGTLATQRLAEQTELLRAATEREAAASERAYLIKKTQIDAALQLAKAKGDEAEAARLLAESLRLEIERGQERSQQLSQQIAQTERHIQLLYAAANADGIYSDAERKIIDGLKDKAAEMQREQAQIEAGIPLKEREAQQAAIMAGSIGELTRLYAEQTIEHERAAAASDRYYDTQLKEIDGAIKVAQAKGDEAETARLQAQQQQILIEQAEALAAAKAQEAQDAQRAVEVKTLELAADGELTKADLEQLAALQDASDAKQAAATQAISHADAMHQEAAASREATEAAAKAAAETQRQADAEKQHAAMVQSFAAASSTAYSLLSNAAIQALTDTDRSAQGITRLGDAFLETADKVRQNAAAMTLNYGSASGQMVREFEHQRTVLNDYAAQLEQAAYWIDRLAEKTSAGTVTMQDVADATHAAELELGYLNEQDLAQLRGAIDDANGRLREMQDEAQSAQDRLAELNADLLEARGLDQKAALLRQELDYQQQLNEIEAQRAKAEADHNRDLLATLDRQKTVLAEINRVKLANLQADADAEKAAAAAKANPPPPAASGGSNSSGSSGRVYTLNLTAGNRSLQATTPTDPRAFLDDLEAAQRRST